MRFRVSAWPAGVAALAVLSATTGDGAWARRSAIGWMMGSWGVRLSVQALYSGRAEPPVLTSYVAVLLTSIFFSLPAMIASRNAAPSLSSIEIAASVLWIVGFAGETTADRQVLRFLANPDNAGRACRSGLWRYIPNAHAVFEALIWTSFAVFAYESPWGWIALACPLARMPSLVDLRPRR